MPDLEVPLVVRTVSANKGKGVIVVKTVEELLFAIKVLLDLSSSGQVLIEQVRLGSELP